MALWLAFLFLLLPFLQSLKDLLTQMCMCVCVWVVCSKVVTVRDADIGLQKLQEVGVLSMVETGLNVTDGRRMILGGTLEFRDG